MRGAYDGNPYASEQGPADDETDPITEQLEAADEYLSEAMGEWAGVEEVHLPEIMQPLFQARECIAAALSARYAELQTYQPDPKPGNECRFCPNWVDVFEGQTVCAACQVTAEAI